MIKIKYGSILLLLIVMLNDPMRTKNIPNDMRFISETEMRILLEKKKKVKIGVFATGVQEEWRNEIKTKTLKEIKFFYKTKNQRNKKPKEVTDPKLKSKALWVLKNNINSLLHFPFKYFSWIFGAQNFADLSKSPDYPKLKKLIDLIEVVPIRMSVDANNIKAQLSQLDGVIFPGGDNYFFKKETKKEFFKYFDSNGIPKTTLKHRFPTKMLESAKLIVQEVEKINLNGRFLPLWGICQGFQLIVMSSVSPGYNMDSYYDGGGNLHLLKRFSKNNSTQSESMQNKKYSLQKMIDLNFPEIEDGKFSPYYHIHGFAPKNLTKDKTFTSKYNILYTSSQNDFKFPEKRKYDPFRRVEDRYKINPDELNPRFVGMIEHKELPIYASQFHPEIFFDYLKSYDFSNMDELRNANIMYPKFFISMIVREKLKRLDLEEDIEVESYNGYEENKLKFFDDMLGNLGQWATNKFVRDFQKFEYSHDKFSNIKNKVNMMFNVDTGIDEIDDKLETVLENISGMAVVDSLEVYENVGLIWKR